MSRNPAVPVREPSRFSENEAARIRLTLDRVIASPQFRSSRRCQTLLQHITELALSGVAVFGRDPGYDTNQDPVVRTTAGEIRKKLAQYYQEPDHERDVKIALLPGSYHPEFHLVAEEEKPAPKRPPMRRKGLRIGAAAVLCAAAGLSVWVATRPSPLEQFWGRMLDSPGGVLICLGQPPAYNFRSDRVQVEMGDKMERESRGETQKPPESIPLRDLVPLPDRYVAFGDALCLVRLTGFFDKHKTGYYLRGSVSTSFTDLREHPSTLIGAFDNDWTLRFGEPLRFTFYKTYDDPKRVIEMIRDRWHPERTDWRLTNSWPYWNISHDYAIVTRLMTGGTDRMIVSVAGITQFGTVASGEFLSKPEYFAEALPTLPADWPKRNLQIVLRVPVVNGANGRPQVLATHTW